MSVTTMKPTSMTVLYLEQFFAAIALNIWTEIILSIQTILHNTLFVARQNAPMIFIFHTDVIPSLWIDFDVRTHLHLVTATQIFDIVSLSSEMGYIVTNVTIRT